MPSFSSNNTLLDAFGGSSDPLDGHSSLFDEFGDVFAESGGVAFADSLINDVATAMWDGSTFGPAIDFWIKIPTKPADGAYATVFGRARQFGLTADGYAVLFTAQAGTDEITIERFDDAVGTQLGSTVSQDFSAGDWMGIRLLKDYIQGWHYTGGVWYLRIERTDGTYSDAGAVGFGTSTTTNGFDDESGGNYNPITNRRRMSGSLYV